MFSFYFKSEQDPTFVPIDEPKEGCWIHVDDVNASDITEISKLTNIEYADIYDCLDKYEVPRIEKEDGDVILFTRYPTGGPSTGLYTMTLTILLTKHYVITICPIKSDLIHALTTQKPKVRTDQQTKFLLYILRKITQEYTLQIKKIRAQVLMQEKDLSMIQSEDIIALTESDENLNQYLSSLVPLRAVLEALARGRYLLLQENDEDLLEDLLNASVQSEDLCSVNLRSIRSLRDSYQIIFTNQVTKTIKLLTALTIILSLPTMIASLYGMNVRLPFANLHFAFILILLFILAIGAISLVLFKRKKWL